MFETSIGPVRDEGSLAYLRPGDGAGHLRQLQERHLVAARQAAVRHRADRQELPQRDHARELPLPDARVRADGDGVLRPAGRGATQWYEYWIAERRRWYLDLGLRESHLRVRAHDADELSHYSSGTSDLEYLFPIGWSELEGIANRGDFDLTAHAEHSGTKLEWIGHEERYVPHVIEPAAGADRAALAFLVDAYDEEEVGGEHAHRAAAPPAPRAGEGRGAAAVGKDAALVEQGAAAVRGAAARDAGRVRRLGLDRQALPPPGRDRHAVGAHDRPRRRSRTARSRSATATRSRRSGSRSTGARELLLERLERPGRPAASAEWRWQELALESEALAGNPLGDPATRPRLRLDAAVVRRRAERRFPSIYVLQGMTGQARGWFNVSPFAQTFPEIVEEARARGDRRARRRLHRASAARSSSTRPRSAATARTSARSVVPFVDARFRTLPEAAHRGVAGKSSGGFGAMVWAHAAARPLRRASRPTRATRCSRSRYRREFAAAAQALREPLRRLVRRVLGGLPLGPARALERRPTTCSSTSGRCRPRTPHPDGSSSCRSGLDTGELVPEVWAALARVGPGADGARASTARRCARCAAIWIDAGRNDEYLLDLGAVAFRQAVDGRRRAGRRRPLRAATRGRTGHELALPAQPRVPGRAALRRRVAHNALDSVRLDSRPGGLSWS